MKLFIKYFKSYVIDCLVILLLFTASGILAHLVEEKYHQESIKNIVLITCFSLSYLYIISTNIWSRSLGFVIQGLEFISKKRIAVFSSNVIYWSLTLGSLYLRLEHYNSAAIILGILLLVENIPFFISGINTRLSLYLLKVNLRIKPGKSRGEINESKICI